MKRTHRTARRLQTGVSLIESLVCLAITTAGLGATLPSFEKLRAQRHFDGAAAQLETDIHFARSLAVTHNHSLRMSFHADTLGTCYVVHTGDRDDCSCNADGSAACTGGASALRSVRFAPGAALELRANVGSILFDPIKGTSTPTGTLRLQGRDDRRVHLVVNLMGRVRTCSPDAAVPGYRAC
jgi:type IV fimbrial biogenesis protein FimT